YRRSNSLKVIRGEIIKNNTFYGFFFFLFLFIRVIPNKKTADGMMIASSKPRVLPDISMGSITLMLSYIESPDHDQKTQNFEVVVDRKN
ncbi:MAG: hypothetical protein ACW97X_02465, partial [Candidatus Hodarchaeales archaeon]